MRRVLLRLVPMAIAVVLMVLGCAGCATATKRMPPVTTSPPPPDVPAVLSPGDEISIKFYYAPELNESQVVRQDGMITLQLVGDMKAAGLTPTGLEKKIEERFLNLIDKSDATVVLQSMRNRVVYVGGAVLRPRAVEMPGRLTVMAAVMEAGGFEYRSAAPRQVVVLREGDGRYDAYVVNLLEAAKGEPAAPFYLLPRDIVYVSRKRIADVNLWIDQYITGMIPLGISASRSSGNTSYGIDTSR